MLGQHGRGGYHAVDRVDQDGMIGLGTGVRVFLACGATVMRKGIASLSIVEQFALDLKHLTLPEIIDLNALCDARSVKLNAKRYSSECSAATSCERYGVCPSGVGHRVAMRSRPMANREIGSNCSIGMVRGFACITGFLRKGAFPGLQPRIEL